MSDSQRVAAADSSQTAGDFNSRQGIQRFVDENGIDWVRDMAAGHHLAEPRRGMVRRWLAEYDRALQAADEAQRAMEANEIAGRAAAAAEVQAAEARRSADAAEQSAKASILSANAARASARYALVGCIVAALAFVVSVVGLFMK